MSGILVLAEHRRGELRASSLEAISAAIQLKDAGGGPVLVVVIAADPEKYVEPLAVGRVDEIITVANDAAKEFEPHIYQSVLHQIIEDRRPAVVLVPHSVDGWGLAPALAAALDAGFASDVFAIAFEEQELVATRVGYQEKVCVEIGFPRKSCVVLTLRSGAFPLSTGRAAPVVTALEVNAGPPRSFHLGWEDPPSTGGIDIPGSSFIVAIGRGVGEESNVEQFLELADSLGATLGCSRPIADNGWLPKARQVGQSGQLAANCKLYIAMGISGSVQHQWGMKHVETIIAVNKDPEASIFGIAKYGIVGDMFEIADELRKQIAAR